MYRNVKRMASRNVSPKYLEQSFRSDWRIDGISSSDDSRIRLIRFRIFRTVRMIFLLFGVQVQKLEAGATHSTGFRFFELKRKLLPRTFVANNL